MTAAARGARLLGIARQAIDRHLGASRCDATCAVDDWLLAPGASFVTLTQDGALRGCIGRLEAERALHADVAANAVAAAFHDPRFEPLAAPEWPGIRIGVSLLSAREPLACASEAQALALLRPGTDGLVFSWHGRRSTFLPQVWEQLPDPADFLDQLRRKAGLPAGFWAEDVQLERYTVSYWREDESPAVPRSGAPSPQQEA